MPAKSNLEIASSPEHEGGNNDMTDKSGPAVEASKEDNAAPDPFNVAALRLGQSFEEATGVKKLLTTVPVRKPHKQEWIRVHPSEDYRGTFGLIDLKEAGEFYLLTPEMARDLSNEIIRVMIYTVINRQHVVFLWAARLPTPDGRINAWHTSAHEAAELAMKRSVRVKANMALGAYETDITDNPIPENDPVWPDLPFVELLRIGFLKNGRWVNSFEHPVVKQLRGL
jgi:hypothetical protein